MALGPIQRVLFAHWFHTTNPQRPTELRQSSLQLQIPIHHQHRDDKQSWHDTKEHESRCFALN